MPKPERVLRILDAFATCPHDGKVLKYYKSVFEAAYVLLHPFIKPVSVGKEQFRPETYPTRSNIIKNCNAVPWGDVVTKAGLPSMKAVDIGLRSMILGLRKDLCNEDYADRIRCLSDSDDILPPSEGCFSDFLYDRVLGYIQQLGHDWVWVGDDSGTERKLYWIEDLKEDNSSTRYRRNIFTRDNSILWTVHWDSHFSFLCSSKSNLANVESFEGFFCTPDTEVYWSVRP